MLTNVNHIVKPDYCLQCKRMTVKNLSNTSFEDLLDCFLLAFDNYFVKMPTDPNYYKQRWKAAKVDFKLSYGMFDGEKLVGFIIHAIDNRFGKLTAFNTGTGVIPAYRGKRIVKSIYAFALKDLQENGIEKSTLEVIRENEVAVRAYKGVGFKIQKRFECYAGDIQVEKSTPFALKEIALKDVNWEGLPNQQFHSWDFQKETILEADYTFFHVLKDNVPESFFIINPQRQRLAQLDLLNTENEGWERLFSAIKLISSTVSIINVDDRLADKVEQLRLAGLKNTVNQYELALDIKDGNWALLD
jgi:ribosomal protein S18 acetylase RimI-like enzyme